PRLPDAVDFVSQAPILHVVRLGVAMSPPQIGVLRVCSAIAILHPVGGFLNCSRSEINAEVRFGLHATAVIDKLVGPEAIRFAGKPGAVKASRTLILRSDAVLPVIGRGEIAARPADHGRIETANSREDILAKSLSIGQRRAFFVDAAVDAAAQMLGELTKDHWVDASDDLTGVDLDAGDAGCLGLSSQQLV